MWNNNALLAGIALTLSGFVAGPAMAGTDCVSWSVGPDLPGSNSLGAKVRGVFDSVRGVSVVVMPNGETIQGAGDNWTVEATNSEVGSIPSHQAAIAYRSATAETLVYSLAGQLWSWDGDDWTLLPDPPFPVRFRTAMCYDSVRDRIVLFGGDFSAGEQTDETWEFDGTTWVQIQTPTTPPARDLHAMAFDASRGKVVMFGGRAASEHLGDVWEYDGTDWVERTDEDSPSPFARYRAEMVYHSDLQVVLMYGGSAVGMSTNDLWQWDGTRWVERHPGLTVSGDYQGLIYEETTNVVRSIFPDHLQMILSAAAEQPVILDQPQSTEVVEGEPVQFSVNATGSDGLTFQWRHNGVAIPGATTSGFGMFAATQDHAGVYDCIIRSAGYGDLDCGKVISSPATLTVLSSCPADLVPNEQVDVSDLLELLSAWGTCSSD